MHISKVIGNIWLLTAYVLSWCMSNQKCTQCDQGLISPKTWRTRLRLIKQWTNYSLTRNILAFQNSKSTIPRFNKMQLYAYSSGWILNFQIKDWFCSICFSEDVHSCTVDAYSSHLLMQINYIRLQDWTSKTLVKIKKVKNIQNLIIITAEDCIIEAIILIWG